MQIVISGSAAVSSSRSPSVAFGAGYTPVANDIVLFACNNTTAVATIAVPAGWVNCHPSGGNTLVASDAHEACVIYHVVTSAEATAVTTTYTATNLWSTTITGTVVGTVIRGVNQANILDSSTTNFDSANAAQNAILAALTAANLSDGSLAVGCCFKDGTSTFSNSGDWTIPTNASYNTTQGSCIVVRGTRTRTLYNVAQQTITAGSNDEYVTYTLAFGTADPVRAPAFGGTGVLTATGSGFIPRSPAFAGHGTLAATAQPVYPSNILYDTFTDTNYVILYDHTGEVGATWSLTSGYTGLPEVYSNRLTAGNAEGHYNASATPPSADYSVCARIYTASKLGYMGVMARSGGTDTYYTAYIYQDSTVWLERGQSGNDVTLGLSAAVSCGVGTTHTLELKVQGSTLNVYWDDSLVIGPVTDGTYSAAGKPAIIEGGSALPWYTVGFQMEEIWFKGPSVERSVAFTGHGALTPSRYPKHAVSKAFTGHGALSALAELPNSLAPALAGHGALTVTRYPKIAVSKGFTGTGTLSATAMMYRIAVSVPRTGIGTLSATRYPKHAVTKAFTGTGTLSATAMMYRIAVSVPRTGIGTLSATRYPKHAVTKAFTGTGTLSFALVEREKSTTGLTGVGALTATKYQKFAVTRNFTGTGTLSATAQTSGVSYAVLHGTGTLSATATLYRIAKSVSYSGSGALAATRYPKFAVTKAFGGTGLLTPAATMYRIAKSVSLGGHGALIAAAAARYARLLPLGGTGTLYATATMYRIARSAGFAGHGALSANAYSSSGITATYSGTGTLSAQARMYRIAKSVSYTGIGVFSATAKPKFAITKAFAGSGVLSATATMYGIARSVGYLGHGALGATATARYARAAALYGSGSLSAQARMYRIARMVALHGDGTLDVVLSGSAARDVAFGGAGALSAAIRVRLSVGLTGVGVLQALVQMVRDVDAYGSGALHAQARVTLFSLDGVLGGSGEITVVTSQYLGIPVFLGSRGVLHALAVIPPQSGLMSLANVGAAMTLDDESISDMDLVDV